MAGVVLDSVVESKHVESTKDYRLPFSAMATLFFLWGFITVLNDILIPHLKHAFDLNYTKAMLIQFCFFGAYFIVSVPAGMLVRKIGYKKGVIVGLLIASLGCLLFYPAAAVHLYWVFLLALFVLASGITVLQVSANPYVAALGPEKTASSRLNLAQALNSLGTTLAPKFGGLLFFSTAATAASVAGADAVKLPYMLLALTLLILAVIFIFLKLPELQHEETQANVAKQSILTAPHTIFGAVAIFFYVGAEVSIGSFLINYFGESSVGGLIESEASAMLAYYWGGAMVGRFVGSVVTRVIKPQVALLVSGVIIIILLMVSMFSSGNIAMWSILAVGLFNSIMFPTIFSLAINGLGSQRSQGSGLLCLAIVGGAIIPLMQGVVADVWQITISFIVPALCYFFIIWYACNVDKFTKKWLQLKQ